MSKIAVLPDHIVNLISAGEVVERPASVVRELVDNSLDAGATEVQIFIEGGGQNLIRVVDNGQGMGRQDALLAFERHATSKIKSESDLDGILTLGFRGEALPSIAAVSKLKLKSRSQLDEVATTVLIEAGELIDCSETAGNVGTDIEVRHLFYNTPARRKFLRQPKTEESRIKHWLKHYALSRPETQFKLFFDGKQVLTLLVKGSALERAAEIFDFDGVEVRGRFKTILVNGLIAHPSMAQYDPGSLAILVNGRLVQDRMILKAVKEGFDSTLKRQEIPVGFIHIELPPSAVDVNVHPQKSEVRFSASQEVFLAVREAVLRAVHKFNTPLNLPNNTQSQSEQSSTAPLEIPRMQRFDFTSSIASQNNWVPLAVRTEAEEPFRFSDLRYVGQILSCYLLCEYAEKLYVVDMHAAHERYNYNLVRNGYRNKSISSQGSLIPQTIELGSGLQNIIRNEALFTQFGFEIEPFGESAVLVRAVPALLVGRDILPLFKEIAAIEYDCEAQGKFEEVIDKISARIACHASIRSGKEMKSEEVYALFNAMDRTEFSAACPHGRPVIVSFSAADIERWFGRDR